MSIIYTFNNKVLKNSANDKWLIKVEQINPNPLNLPANTIRVKFSNYYTPTMGDSRTLVDSTNNVWDIYKQSNIWDSLFNEVDAVREVIGANTSNVIKMYNMFKGCSRLATVSLFDTSKVKDMSHMFEGCSLLTSVPLFDTSKVTNMLYMFYSCESLTTVPLYDTSNVTDMSSMFYRCTSLTSIPLFNTSKVIEVNETFYNCTNVEHGALALYNQMSTQTNPPGSHNRTFRYCGSDTPTGQAELSQIPESWGGLA